MRASFNEPRAASFFGRIDRARLRSALEGIPQYHTNSFAGFFEQHRRYRERILLAYDKHFRNECEFKPSASDLKNVALVDYFIREFNDVFDACPPEFRARFVGSLISSINTNRLRSFAFELSVFYHFTKEFQERTGYGLFHADLFGQSQFDFELKIGSKSVPIECKSVDFFAGVPDKVSDAAPLVERLARLVRQDNYVGPRHFIAAISFTDHLLRKDTELNPIAKAIVESLKSNRDISVKGTIISARFEDCTEYADMMNSSDWNTGINAFLKVRNLFCSRLGKDVSICIPHPFPKAPDSYFAIQAAKKANITAPLERTLAKAASQIPVGRNGLIFVEIGEIPVSLFDQIKTPPNSEFFQNYEEASEQLFQQRSDLSGVVFFSELFHNMSEDGLSHGASRNSFTIRNRANLAAQDLLLGLNLLV